MPVFSISYDLNKQDKDYAGLFFKIPELGDCIKPLKSMWLVASDKLTVDSIYEALLPFIDSNDFLFVQVTPPGCRWQIIEPSCLAWLSARL